MHRAASDPLSDARPRRSRGLILVASVAIAMAACGTDATDDPTTPAAATSSAAVDPTSEPAAEPTSQPSTEPAADPTGDATVAVAESSLGQILVDADGMTLYVFDVDPVGDSACTDSCVSAWPPLVAEAVAGEGVTGTLDTFARSDGGGDQVTINGRALYTWAQDSAPGDVTGQGVNDVWWVVAPDGTAITGDAAATESAATGYGDPAT